MGAGVHATTALDGFYADVQAAATWYEVDLKSQPRPYPLRHFLAPGEIFGFSGASQGSRR